MEALITIFLLFITLFIIIGGLVYLRVKWSTVKGKAGEKGVATLLSFLSKDEYVVLNDMMYKDGSYSTQIDHIVVSLHGIFIIETKNYKGWIFGNSNKDYWTQNIWGNKYSFYNPILQNRNHIKFLMRKFDILRDKGQWIYPIVVFLSATKLNLSGDCKNVLWLRELNHYIRSYSQNIMTIEDCHYIASIFQAENIEDKKERKSHRANVYAAKCYHESKISHGICPMCGGQLVLRTGKYGEFYGCSNYPRCRYTR